MTTQTSTHPFQIKPHRTLLALSIPVLLSMTAEPLLALIDTAFISSLGVEALAALGVGTTALSTLFWIFNFLSVGTQTEVAQMKGRGETEQVKNILSLALILAFGFGLMLIFLFLPSAKWLGELLGASGKVLDLSLSYMQIRFLAAPAVLIMMVSFGAMRGLQDMRTPLLIAIGVNALNLLLDWLLIFGAGPIPALGVAGSAYASTISQWLGAVAALMILARTIGLTSSFSIRDAKKFIAIGGDLFIRTAMINLFLAYLTRVANGLGPSAGAAHQVLRQVFVFTALALDAYASTVQSLVGYFIGQDSIEWVKRVVKVGTQWAVGTGVMLGGLMWIGRGFVIDLMVPTAAVAIFLPTWAISSLTQPINAIAFLMDGVHWGTGDFRFLRNVMLPVTIIGIASIWILSQGVSLNLSHLWAVTGLWLVLRASFGVLRVWPGIGNSIFKKS